VTQRYVISYHQNPFFSISQSVCVSLSLRQHFHCYQKTSQTQNSFDKVQKWREQEDVLTVAASATKLQLAPRLAHPHAIIAVLKDTSPGTARWKPRPSHATNAVKKVTFPAIALIVQVEEEEGDGLAEEAEEATRTEAVAVAVVVANATAAENPATLLVTVLVLAAEAAEEETTALSVEEEIRRLVIPVAVWVTCLVTVFRARSATTALEWAISAEIALNPKSVPATHADLRATSPVTAQELVPMLQLDLSQCVRFCLQV